MTEFDYVCLFLAIPVGLALTELAQGISLALRRRDQISLGRLTPLLLLFVLFLSALMIETFWQLREQVVVNAGLIFAGLVFTIVFYVAASFVFPERADDRVSLDEWFMQSRRFSLGGTSALVLIAFFTFLHFDVLETGRDGWIEVIVLLAFLAVAAWPIARALRAPTIAKALRAMILLDILYGALVITIIVTMS
ncbi:hypothetical protein [Pseudoblastomonas halimionae]|uniref:Uncharacterized protein n=1 Tax=Alteriqipengyuania halimionae TaxID=1926630 RepID=A0A6I4U1J8_9SPHN|nr:hypothetical protein [Alteriqipengyuania halimionae]MXP09576.1 hypothetical protein [Alteriqipengyuania halimionae]